MPNSLRNKKHKMPIKTIAILISLIFLSENAGYSFTDISNNKTTLRPPMVFSKEKNMTRPAAAVVIRSPIAILETPLGSYDYRLAIQRAREWIAAKIAGGTIGEEMSARAHALLESDNLGLRAFMELLASRYDTLRPENIANLPKNHVEFLDNARGTFAEVAGIKETQIIFVSKEDRFLWALGSREMADNPPGGMRVIFSDEQGYVQQVIMVPYEGYLDKADIVYFLSHEAEHCREALLASQRYVDPLIKIIIEGRQRFWQSDILIQFRERLINEARRRVREGGDYHLVYQLVRLLNRSMTIVSYPRAEKFVSQLIELAGKEAIDNIHKTGEVEQLVNVLGQERFEALVLFFREWDQKSFLHSSTAAGLSIGLAMDIAEAVLLKGDSGKLPSAVFRLREFMDFLQSQESLVGEDSQTLEQILLRGVQADRDIVLRLAVAYAKEEIGLENVKHKLFALRNFFNYTIAALSAFSGARLTADEGTIKESVWKSGIAGLSFEQAQAIQDIVNICGVTVIVVGSAASDQFRLQEARTQREGSPRPIQDIGLIVIGEGQIKKDAIRMLVQALQGLGPAVELLEDKTPSFPGEPMITFRPNQLPYWFQGLDKYYLTGAAAKPHKSQLARLVAVELEKPSSPYCISSQSVLVEFLRTGQSILASFSGERRKVTFQEVATYAIRQANLVLPDWNETDWKDFLFAVRMCFPDNPDVCCYLGRRYYMQGQYQEAEQALKKALKIDPNITDAHVQLGMVYAARDNHYHAIQEYEAALALKPTDTIAYYNLAKSYHARGNIAGAIQAYQTAITFNPKLVNAYWNLALVYHKLHKRNKAIENFAHAVFMDPGSINEVPHELRSQVQKRAEKFNAMESAIVTSPVASTVKVTGSSTTHDVTPALRVDAEDNYRLLVDDIKAYLDKIAYQLYKLQRANFPQWYPENCGVSQSILAEILSQMFHLPIMGDSANRLELVNGMYVAEDGRRLFDVWIRLVVNNQPKLLISASAWQFERFYDLQEQILYIDYYRIAQWGFEEDFAQTLQNALQDFYNKRNIHNSADKLFIRQLIEHIAFTATRDALVRFRKTDRTSSPNYITGYIFESSDIEWLQRLASNNSNILAAIQYSLLDLAVLYMERIFPILLSDGRLGPFTGKVQVRMDAIKEDILRLPISQKMSQNPRQPIPSAIAQVNVVQPALSEQTTVPGPDKIYEASFVRYIKGAL